MRAVVVSLFAGLTVSALATSAGAQTDIDQIPVTPPPLAAVGAAEFALHDAPTSLRIDVDALSDSLALQQGGSPRTVAVEYSDAYAVRRKIAMPRPRSSACSSKSSETACTSPGSAHWSSVRQASKVPSMSRSRLFSRIVPMMKDIGLWGPKIRRAYEKMGIIGFCATDMKALAAEDEAVAERFELALQHGQQEIRATAATALA